MVAGGGGGPLCDGGGVVPGRRLDPLVQVERRYRLIQFDLLNRVELFRVL